jgi:hypothetical protein
MNPKQAAPRAFGFDSLGGIDARQALLEMFTQYFGPSGVQFSTFAFQGSCFDAARAVTSSFDVKFAFKTRRMRGTQP